MDELLVPSCFWGISDARGDDLSKTIESALISMGDWSAFLLLTRPG